jgi:hypothetical protein
MSEERPMSATIGRGRRARRGAARSAEARLVLLVLLLAAVAGGWWFLGRRRRRRAPADVDGEIVAAPPLTTTVGTVEPAPRPGVAGDRADRGRRPRGRRRRLPLLQDALLREMAAMDADELRSAEGSDALRARLSVAARRRSGARRWCVGSC